MVNIVKTNANAEISFPTLDRYREVYSLLLSNYLREYKSNTEKRFIELQIEHYKTYCDEYLNNSEYTFNKYQLERFYTDRLVVIEYLENKLKDFPEYINREIKKENTKEKTDLIFTDFIFNVNDKESFAEDLKNTFNIEKGKNLRIVFELLNTESIVNLTDGNLSSFHKTLVKHFDQYIGVYESYRKATEYDTISIEKIKAKLNPLITKHKSIR